jgi:hypothetical protein
MTSIVGRREYVSFLVETTQHNNHPSFPCQGERSTGEKRKRMDQGLPPSLLVVSFFPKTGSASSPLSSFPHQSLIPLIVHDGFDTFGVDCDGERFEMARIVVRWRRGSKEEEKRSKE